MGLCTRLRSANEHRPGQRPGARLGPRHLLLGVMTALAGSQLLALPTEAADRGLDSIPARGVVRPINQATISTDLQARVSMLAVKEGAAFKAGDVLVEFDCRRYRAELASALAQRREAELALDNNLVLNEHRAIGKHEVEISRARVDRAAGDAEVLASRVDDCRILAPFEGRVAELAIHVHETPVAGRPFISLINDRKLEIEMIVPSTWLAWLRDGASFDFHVDELKRILPAKVTRIGAAVDPVSQTVKLVGTFTDAADLSGVLAGMSGAADFTPGRG